MATDAQIQNRITARMNELRPLHTRMDNTRASVYNLEYHMKTLDGKKNLDNVINVRMPYAPIIANTVINDIQTSFRQAIVEGNISAATRIAIEGFINDSRLEADEKLVNSDWHAYLFDIWANHVCIRSYFGVRWVTQIVDGKWVIDCLPVDMRYVPYEYGNDNFNWVTNRSFRSWSKIESQYGQEIKEKGISPPTNANNTLIQVDDYWDGEVNKVYIGGTDGVRGSSGAQGTLAREQKNPFGEPPFVITAPATGFMLRDKDYIAHDSEDILFLIREILGELNRSASIEQTKGFETLRPPYVEPVEKMDSTPAEAVPITSQVKKYEKGQEPKLLATPDVNQAFLTSRQDLQRMVQMGGVNDIDLGNVSQSVSAVWITAQAGIRKKFSGPRLKSLADGDQQLARMITRQAKLVVELEEGSPDILVGRQGSKNKYSPEKLPEPEKYSIRYEYRSQSKTEEIANLAQYEASPDLPVRWRLEHLLGVDDPDAIIRQMDLEDARAADPAIGLSEMGVSLAREAAEIDDEQESDLMKYQSMLLIERAVALIKQRLNPAPEQTTGEQVLPRRRARGNQPVSELVKLPKLLEATATSPLSQPPETPAQ